MRATPTPLDTAASKASVDAPPAPFSRVFVTITKQEHIELRLAATHSAGLHRKAVLRYEQQEFRHTRLISELKAEAAKAIAAVQAELDVALAQVRDLQMRLFSTKSEQSRPSESRSKAASCRKRGQRVGSVGHGAPLQPT